jgi:protein O-mannosyl-transferase
MKRRGHSKLVGNTPAASNKEKTPAAAGHSPAPPARSAGVSVGWVILLAPVVIALAAVAAYQNSFAGTFVLDDVSWIEGNASIRHLWPISQVLFPTDASLVGGRPVVSLTLAVNYALGGMNVWGYHAVNLAIHVLAAWALFGITRRTLVLPQLQSRFGSAATPLALVVALLWLIHPLQTEAVTYVIQRTEALAGLFYLLVLYCVIRGATSSGPIFWYIAATAACLLGMATKEVMATAPLIVLIYDRTFLAGSFREVWRRRYGLYLALAATWAVIALLLFSTGFYGGTTGFAVQKSTCWSYLLTQTGVIVHYLRLAFWPVGLCFDYGWPPAHGMGEVFLPGILVLGLLVLTVWALFERPAWGFLGAWFFMILAPSSSFVPIKDAAFEHRMYLSLAAIVVGVVIGGWLVGQWLVGRGTIRQSALWISGGALAAFAAVALGLLTFERNADYHSVLSVWEDTVAKAPGNERAHYNLGVTLASSGRAAEAITHYQRALEIKPDHELAHNNLGLALARGGQLDDAIAHYQKALEIKPDFAEAHYNLGLVLAKRGQADEAIAQYKQALEFKPDYAEAHNDLGIALAKRGRFEDAADHFFRAVQLKPDDAGIHNNLGIALASRGRLDEAIAHFRKALEIEPDFADARTNLDLTLGRRRKTE